MNRIILTSCLLILCFTAQSQDWKRTQNWYFGDSAGLSFATEPPTVLTDGAMYALEGCATISDTAGNLLFYTNGLTVWNKNHQVMKNGTGLFGFESSGQAALAVPQPNNDSIFYIFTNGAETILSPFGLYYSIVNMRSDGGLGEVVDKNILLIRLESEKLAATHHANGQDIWVATHGDHNNLLYSFLVTSFGVIPCPVISQTGSLMEGGSIQTEMRFSPSGRIAGVLFWNDGFMELLNFDNQTGRFSNPIKIITSPKWVSGLAFSNDDKWLVLSARWSWIRCYNLDLLNITAINNSMRTLFTDVTGSVNGQFCNTQDNRILFNWAGKNYLGGIQFGPADTQVTFIDSAVSIAPGTGTYGMPQFISSYFYNPKLDIHYKTNCWNDSVAFSVRSSQSLVSPSWDIYKNSNLLYSVSGHTLNHVFQDTGTYLVRLTNGGDTVVKELFIEPQLELGNDTLLCNIADFKLTVPDNIRCIQWQDGSDTTTYTITQNGVYYVSGYNSRGCIVSDTIRVKFGSVPQVVITRSGDSLFTDIGSYTFQWYYNNVAIGTDNPFIRINQTGNYTVEISDSVGCTVTSAIFPVSVLSAEKISRQNIRVFPNPLTEGQILNIEYQAGINIIEVYDAKGKRVYSDNYLNTNAISIPGLNKGIYFIRINQIYTATINIY